MLSSPPTKKAGMITGTMTVRKKSDLKSKATANAREAMKATLAPA